MTVNVAGLCCPVCGELDTVEISRVRLEHLADTPSRLAFTCPACLDVVECDASREAVHILRHGHVHEVWLTRSDDPFWTRTRAETFTLTVALYSLTADDPAQERHAWDADAANDMQAQADAVRAWVDRRNAARRLRALLDMLGLPLQTGDGE